VRQWQEIFEREGRALVQKLVARGEFDAVQDLAEAFVTTVFPRALGVEITQQQAVLIGDYGFNGIGPHNELFWQTHEQMQPLQEYMARSRTREVLLPGGWSNELFDAEDAGKLPPGTASSLMLTLIRGGMDTTISGIGTALAQLSRNPDQWALVRDDPSRARAAFEEAIRFESPLHTYYRATTTDVEFAGHRLKDDVKVQMFIGAANRDPRKFSDPDKYDIMRNTLGHTAFGGGVHTCIGQMIARLEAESVLKVFAEMVSEFRIEGPLHHRPSNALRTYAHLPTKVLVRRQ
jgi:cytochrome P450